MWHCFDGSVAALYCILHPATPIPDLSLRTASMLSSRRWKQLAALAAAGGSAYLAYKRLTPPPSQGLWIAHQPEISRTHTDQETRPAEGVGGGRWAAYKEEEEDAEAAEGYYRSRAAGGDEGGDAGANVRPVETLSPQPHSPTPATHPETFHPKP